MTPVEISIPELKGKSTDYEIEFVHFVYKGKPARLNIVRDISSRRKIETLEKDIEITREFSRTQAEFFANISHELKTPLNVLLRAIQILELPSDNVEKKLNKYLWTMKQNSYRLLRIVNNLIDLSKVDSGYIKLDIINYDIIKIVEDITLSVADYVENNDKELIFDTDIEEKIMAFDADMLERIMLNLLSNAIKFTSPGGKISVTISHSEEILKISVQDTGVGIPQDKLEYIFDRFAQVDKTLSRSHEGSGIGLALVKSLVTLHGGTITANSILGKGSEFIIELPIKLSNKDRKEKELSYQSNVERISIEFSDIYSE